MKNILVIALIFANIKWAYSALDVPEGRIASPYDACKNIIIVDKKKEVTMVKGRGVVRENLYQKNKEAWDQLEKKCGVKVVHGVDLGVTQMDPLKEGLEYLNFTAKVGAKVIENLDRNKSYLDCSAHCFSGYKSCQENRKEISCEDRRKEIKDAIRVQSTKIRMELALSNDNPGLLNVDIRNVLSLPLDKRINTNLRDFEIFMPNPVGRKNITEREKREAIRRLEFERKKLEDEFKIKNIKKEIYADWMSKRLMDNMNLHRDQYFRLIYEEAPIFSVIEAPEKFLNGSDPDFSDESLKHAFEKLSKNATETKIKMNKTINEGKLEFSRIKGESLVNWAKGNNDLLFLMNMKNQVEEVLEKDPESCGIATTLNSRLSTKGIQNLVPILGGSIVAGIGGGIGLRALAGGALSGATSTALTGLSLGATFVGDSIRQYHTLETSAQTKSGLSQNEGRALTSSEELKNAQTNIILNVVFARADMAGGWLLGRTLYKNLRKKMLEDLPELKGLYRSVNLKSSEQDQLVDKWLSKKISVALKKGTLTERDKEALETKKAIEVLEALTKEIEKRDPYFLKNEKNIELLLKAASASVKKEEGDPDNLGELAKDILLRLNNETTTGTWDPLAQEGILKFYSAAVEELRIAYKKDPATYAKFSTNKEAQEKIMMTALKRAGVVKEDEARYMYQCAMKK